MTQTDAFLYHFERYPKMTPQDAVKLAYQSEFGCGHMIADIDGARRYLSRELASVKCSEPAPPLVEPLGELSARINLATDMKGLSKSTLFSLFLESSKLFSGTVNSFSARLALVGELAFSGRAPFSRAEFDAYVHEYLMNGGGPVHHSTQYSDAYHPAYRVIHSHIASFLPVFSAIDRLSAAGAAGYAVVIDGRCGAGKSTLASFLSRVYGCGVVHADDFYLPLDARKNALGGLDAGRMSREIRAGEDRFTYRVYDPHKDAFSGERTVRTSPFFVIEGSYSLEVLRQAGIRPALSVFLTVGEAARLERLRLRDEAKLCAFVEKWIPAEERYFKEYGIPEKCDIVIDTE